MLYWLFTDETNVSPSEGSFFIYGGLIIASDQVPVVHDAIVEVREKYGFKPEDKFKFQTASRPAHIEVPAWTNAKAEALERAHLLGVEMIAYVVHHGIAKSQQDDVRMAWAVNATVAHFDMRYLAEKDDRGAVCVDRVDPTFGYRLLREKFQNPLYLPDGREVQLQRIVHYSMSCDGASHISSLVDIALGGFRYCVNAAMGKGSDDVAARLLPAVSNLMWFKQDGDNRQIGGYGFLQYPREVKAPAYADEYAALVQGLTKFAGTAA